MQNNQKKYKSSQSLGVRIGAIALAALMALGMATTAIYYHFFL